VAFPAAEISPEPTARGTGNILIFEWERAFSGIELPHLRNWFNMDGIAELAVGATT
jgi:hypothetical protein